MEVLREGLNEYIMKYNTERTHQGKRCQGRTPMETFRESKKLFLEKNLTEKFVA
jgi:hypothetical protein